MTDPRPPFELVPPSHLLDIDPVFGQREAWPMPHTHAAPVLPPPPLEAIQRDMQEAVNQLRVVNECRAVIAAMGAAP